MTPHVARMILALAIVGSLSFAATAQVPKPDACFCLKRKGSDGSAEHLGCERKTPPNAFTPEIICINATTGSEYRLKNAAAFDEVADGKNGCDPCRPQIVPGRHTENPRGDKE